MNRNVVITCLRTISRINSSPSFKGHPINNRWSTVPNRQISVLRPEITDETTANNFVNGLGQSERDFLTEALAHVHLTNGSKTQALTRKLLATEAVYAGVPFLGFGFLDNTIMLCAGEYIDVTLGTSLGISTLAAAAMGNLISDVAGIGTAGTVEQNFKRFLGRSSVLTAAQRETSQSHRWVFSGRCIGICIGCILGMWPLLLYFDDDEKEESGSKK